MVVYAAVVAYVLEMLVAGRLDADLAAAHSQRVHKQAGIVAGAAAGAVARHCDSQYALAVQSQLVEGQTGDEQGVGAVKAAGHSYHRVLAVDMQHPGGQARKLYVDDLVQGFAYLQPVSLWDERQRVELPVQLFFKVGFRELSQVHPEICFAIGGRPGSVRGHRVEGVALQAAVVYGLYVYVADQQAGFAAETLAFREQFAAFANDSPAAEDRVLGGLAPAAAGVDIGAAGPGGLLAHEALAIFLLAGDFVAGREVGYDVRAHHTVVGGRRHRGPEVLAELYPEAGLAQIEEQVAADRTVAAAGEIDDGSRAQVGSGSEPAGLVELAGVGQMDFRNYSVNPSLPYHHSAVVEQSVIEDGGAYDCRDGLAPRVLRYAFHRLFRAPYQGSLGEKVPAGVTRDAEFREHGYGDLSFLRPVDQAAYLFGISLRVSQSDGRGRGGDPHKAMALCIFHILSCRQTNKKPARGQPLYFKRFLKVFEADVFTISLGRPSFVHLEAAVFLYVLNCFLKTFRELFKVFLVEKDLVLVVAVAAVSFDAALAFGDSKVVVIALGGLDIEEVCSLARSHRL